MRTYQIAIVRVGLLFAGTTALLAGHELLSRQLFTQMGAVPAVAGLASVAASLVVWLVGGVFVLPLMKRALRAGRSSAAASVVVGTALCTVAARATVEASTGVTLVDLPLFSLACVIALLGGRSLLAVRVVGTPRALRPVAEPAARLAERTWTRAS